MAVSETCSPVYSLADQIVGSGYDTFRAYANSAFQDAQAAAQALQTFTIDQIPVTVNFNAHGAGGTFFAPPRPTREVDDFEMPPDPPDVEVLPVTLDVAGIGPAPTEPPNTYTYRVPGGQPGALTATDPGDAPTFDDVEFPDTPEYDLPSVPDFYALDLPDVPDLTIPTFDSDRPQITFDAPAQTFTFEEVEYSSDLLDQVTARLALMGQGGTGLPAAIEQALFDRGRSRDDVLAAKAVQEVTEEFANRGCSEPNGVLARRLLEVRQENQSKAAALNRDLTIRATEIEIENLRFFVTQAIALEQVLIGKHMAMEQRRLEAAKYAFDAILQIFNARITLHNAEVEGYKADAQVFRDRIQAELARVELYRAQIEGQRAIGELNKTIADRYETELRGVLALVETYKAEVDARRGRIEANNSRIEGYRATVAAFGERVRAYEAEWSGYRARIDAELGHLTAADIGARTYATHVSAWQTKYQNAFEKARIELGIEDLSIRKFEAQMRKFLGEIEGERARIGSQVAALGADAQVYSAAGQVAAAESASKDRTLELIIARGRTAAELHLKNGEIRVNQALTASGQALEALKAVGSTTAQLAASSLSAINVSAGISHGSSNSQGCSTSFSYSGELAT